MNAAASEMDAALSELRTRLANFRVGAGPLGNTTIGSVAGGIFCADGIWSVALVESLKVRTDAGTFVNLSKMGTLMAKDGQTAVLSLFDSKHGKGLVSQLQSAGLNLSASLEGSKVTILVPR